MDVETLFSTQSIAAIKEVRRQVIRERMIACGRQTAPGWPLLPGCWAARPSRGLSLPARCFMAAMIDARNARNAENAG